MVASGDVFPSPPPYPGRSARQPVAFDRRVMAGAIPFCRVLLAEGTHKDKDGAACYSVGAVVGGGRPRDNREGVSRKEA